MKKAIVILFHLFFWLGTMWYFTQEVELDFGAVIKEKHDSFLPIIYGTIINSMIFYLTCYWLIPNFYRQKTRRKFWFISVGILFLITFFESMVDLFWVRNNFPEKYDLEYQKDIFITTFLFALVVHIFWFFIAFAYRFPIDRRRQREREQLLEKEKLQTELKFLKAQIDPHTLFNGMNSIYHLIPSNPEKAQATVLRFSELLRYQLYEVNENFIPLTHEIKYLENYIGINEIRKEEDAIIEYEISLEEEVLVAPMIFTAFVENAFKYLSNHSNPKENKLQIHLSCENEYIHFSAKNTVDLFQKNNSIGGIGIQNTINRLNLIYGEDYVLKYGLEDEGFQVLLSLPIIKKSKKLA